MKLLDTLSLAALLGTALAAQAAGVAPTTGATGTAAKAASAPAVKPVGQPGGGTPAAGGGGGGSITDGSNTGTQVKPKLPKCPDPNIAACAAVKAPVK